MSLPPTRLHEEILLLALRDREGTAAPGANITFALGGALLAGLLLEKRITIEEKKRKKIIRLQDERRFDEPVLDECMQKLQTAKRAAAIETWVQKFSGLKDLKNRIALGLCRKGILRFDEDKVLLIFTRKIYPEIDHGPEAVIIEQLREAVFTEREDIAPKTVVLLSLAKSAGLLPLIFDKKELKTRKKRIEKVISGEMIGKAAKEAVDAVQAAVMVACILPAVTAAAVTTH